MTPGNRSINISDINPLTQRAIYTSRRPETRVAQGFLVYLAQNISAKQSQVFGSANIYIFLRQFIPASELVLSQRAAALI